MMRIGRQKSHNVHCLFSFFSPKKNPLEIHNIMDYYSISYDEKDKWTIAKTPGPLGSYLPVISIYITADYNVMKNDPSCKNFPLSRLVREAGFGPHSFIYDVYTSDGILEVGTVGPTIDAIPVIKGEWCIASEKFTIQGALILCKRVRDITMQRLGYMNLRGGGDEASLYHLSESSNARPHNKSANKARPLSKKEKNILRYFTT